MVLPSLLIVVGFYLLNVVVALDFDCTDIPQELLNVDETDCRGFIVCMDGIAIAGTCPVEMIFDFTEQGCLFGYCENYATTEVNTATEETTIFTTIRIKTTTDQITTTNGVSTAPITEPLTTTEEISTTTDETTYQQTSTTEESVSVSTTSVITEPTTTEKITLEVTEPLTTTEEISTATDETTFQQTSTTEESVSVSTTSVITEPTTTEKITLEVDEDGVPLCNTIVYLYYLPHPHKCTYFILCLAGSRYISSCPLYQSWDIISEQCIASNLATCVEGAE